MTRVLSVGPTWPTFSFCVCLWKYACAREHGRVICARLRHCLHKCSDSGWKSMRTYNNSHCKQRFQGLRLPDILCIIVLVCVGLCVLQVGSWGHSCHVLPSCGRLALVLQTPRRRNGQNINTAFPSLPFSWDEQQTPCCTKKRRIYPQKQIVWLCKLR